MALANQVTAKLMDRIATRAQRVLGYRAPEAIRLIKELDVTSAPLIRLYDIPYLAGSSNDGKKVYIDKRLPARLKISGKIVDPGIFLRVHEITEHALMSKMGVSYERAHKVAEEAERAHVEAAGINWMDYEHVLDGYINESEHEKIKSAPNDLYEKPYTSVLKNRMARHQQIVNNGR